MDRTDERILDLLKGNARMTYQELGDRIGMSRVAVKKRVKKLEEAGVIRGYIAAIYREEAATMLLDLVTAPERQEAVAKFLCTRTAYIRQMFRTMENHIHIVAAAHSMEELNYLVRMIRKGCGEDIVKIETHAVKEIIKDVYGGIKKYERERNSVDEDDSEQPGGRGA